MNEQASATSNFPDYEKYDDADLIEAFGRMDPRWAASECARVKELLGTRGYVVRDGQTGPGFVEPTAEKLQALIGSPRPIECRVTFGESAGFFRWLEPAHNDFGLIGRGQLQADGLYVRLTGRRGGLLSVPCGWLKRHEQLRWRDIVDVERDGNWVHFAERRVDSAPRGITICLPDGAAAERLDAVLPRERTAGFRPQTRDQREFEHRLIEQSPHTPVTAALVAINVLIFLGTVLAGADWLRPNGSVQIAWGSNFGPYTTAGDWWRLVTAPFIHFGLLHLLFNLWALGCFGPLAERLLGSLNYLLVYLLSGVAAGLASVAWRPDNNAAGASGAILGILGALLAVQLSVGKTFPIRILRPIRNYTLVYTGYALLAGLVSQGVDNAAHVGGLAAGFVMGWFSAHPVEGTRAYTSRDLRRSLGVVLIAAILTAGEWWAADGASARLAGEGRYWQTLHWLRSGEQSRNTRLKAAMARAKADPQQLPTLTDELERDVLPFWRQASARLAEVRLDPGSAQQVPLRRLQALAQSRVHGYELLADGLRRNDREEIAKSGQELAGPRPGP